MLMRITFLFICLLLSCGGEPVQQPKPLTKQEVNELRKQANFLQEGVASFYGRRFHNRPTASGEAYDTLAFTAAHKSLPLNTKVQVMNIRTGKSVVVRINDRGPYHPKRIIDLSNAAAKSIGLTKEKGITRVLLFQEEELTP